MDFPEVTVIMAHMGLNSLSYTEGAIKMAKKAKNLVLETAGVVYDNPFTKACQAIGGERIVFGSDAPINNPIHEIRKVQVAKMGDEDKREILGENMARILGLWGY
jgi:predicted TIM-barrel fold metal-dependent hydrolase